MRTLALGLLLLVGACVVDDDPVWLDPLTVTRTGKPNDHLVCPEGNAAPCAGAPDARSAWYDLPAERLLRVWREVVQASPRTVITDLAEDRLAGEQRSRLFGFVDGFAIRVLVRDGRAGYAAYSRSLSGYYDFGVNKRRLRTWEAEVVRRLDALDQ